MANDTTMTSGASSYLELKKKIEELQAEANKIKDEERKGVLARILEAIPVYEFTADELFPKRGSAGRKAAAKKAKETPPAAARKPGRPAGKKRRARRTFSDAERQDYLSRHTKMVSAGMSFDAAAEKLELAGSLLRRWYLISGVPVPERKAA